MNRKKHLFPFILITSLFFLWAFLHNINPILIPHLKKACVLSDTQSSFIDLAVYLAYFLVAVPAGLFMHRYGYKNGILTGLCLYATGALLFIPAAAGRNYALFLVALFVIAGGATFLEAVANPYISILGSKEKAAQRLNLAQSFNGLGALIAPIIGGRFILTGVEYSPKDISRMTPSQMVVYLQHEADSVKIPYLVIAFAVLVLLALFTLTKLPEFRSDIADGPVHPGGAGFSLRVLRHSHLRWSIAAQFFYVGAQVGVGSFFIRYAKYVAGINEKNAAFLWGAVAMVGFMTGRFSGTWMMRFVRPKPLLGLYAFIAMLLLLAAVFFNGRPALNALIAVPFFMSIMYPTIFALGIHTLDGETKAAAPFLVMAIIGGAIAPLIMGAISDHSGSIQTAYCVPLLCFGFIFYYAARGYRTRDIPVAEARDQ